MNSNPVPEYLDSSFPALLSSFPESSSPKAQPPSLLAASSPHGSYKFLQTNQATDFSQAASQRHPALFSSPILSLDEASSPKVSQEAQVVKLESVVSSSNPLLAPHTSAAALLASKAAFQSQEDTSSDDGGSSECEYSLPLAVLSNGGVGDSKELDDNEFYVAASNQNTNLKPMNLSITSNDNK